jgi:CspA family cold shock protein
MTDVSRQTGIVKWFDNKKGYGMITVMESTHKGNDVFAHHTEVQVGTQQYRYLVAGEYVSFGVNQIAGDESKFTAVNIKGVLDGPVMCETINSEKLLKNAYNAKRRLEYESATKKAVVVPPPPPPSEVVEKSKKNIKGKGEPPKKRVAKK